MTEGCQHEAMMRVLLQPRQLRDRRVYRVQYAYALCGYCRRVISNDPTPYLSAVFVDVKADPSAPIKIASAGPAAYARSRSSGD